MAKVISADTSRFIVLGQTAEMSKGSAWPAPTDGADGVWWRIRENAHDVMAMGSEG